VPPPRKKNRRRGAFHCFCPPPGGAKPLVETLIRFIGQPRQRSALKCTIFCPTFSLQCNWQQSPANDAGQSIWHHPYSALTTLPPSVSTEYTSVMWQTDRQTDRQRRLDSIALCICEVGRVILYYAIMKHAVGLYIGCSDVTESMVTIWSPFCGYNTV